MSADRDRQRPFELRADAVHAVRQFVREIAQCDGADPDTAALVASELATNAVAHAKSAFVVNIPEHQAAFRVEIINDAPQMIAALRDPDTDRTGTAHRGRPCAPLGN
jgi:anti-sigma regulatory factor (Ser/Thr protein kinase)